MGVSRERLEEQVEHQQRHWVPKVAHRVSWGMLAITTLAILATSIDAQILPTILPGIIKDFHLSAVEAGFLNSLFFFGTIIGAIGFGVLGDVIGTGYRRGWTWIVSMAISVVGGIASWLFAFSYTAFAWLRLPMGVSRGGSEPLNVALVSDWWQRENRGFAVGVHHTGFPIGQFVGPALMALVLALGGDWRAVWLIIPLIGIPIMVAQALLGTRRNQVRVYEWMKQQDLTPPHPEVGGRGQLLNPGKVILNTFSDRNTAISISMIFLFLWAELGALTFMTVYLTQKVHMPLAEAAIVSGASGITGWMGQAFWGTFSDRVGRKFALRIVAVGWTISVLAMMLINSTLSAWLILLFWGLFRNSPYPVTYALLIDSVPAAASSGMGFMIGIAFGVAGLLVSPVAGYFIQHWGFNADYLMLAAACALTLIPMQLLHETVPSDALVKELQGRARVQSGRAS
jgi:MFS family permease